MQKKELWAQRYQRRCNIVRREHGKTAVEGRSCKKHRDEEGVEYATYIIIFAIFRVKLTVPLYCLHLAMPNYQPV